MRLPVYAAAAALAFAPLSASAVTFSLANAPNAGDILPGNFGSFVDAPELVGGTTSLSSWWKSGEASPGAMLEAASGPQLKFTYIGSSAGFENLALTMDGGGVIELFNNKSSTAGDIKIVDFGGGILDFTYETLGGGGGTISNDGTRTNDDLNYATYLFDGDKSAYVLFGDGTGDSDLNDMAVKIQVVPGPFGVLLLGTAFVAAGAVRRFGRAAA